MKNRRKIYLIVSVFFLMIFLLLKEYIYTPQYFWTNDLITAIREENTAKINKLLENESMDINKSGGTMFPFYLISDEFQKMTPFETSILVGNRENIDILLEKGAKPYFKSNAIGWLLQSSDSAGIKSGEEYRLVDNLIKNGADVEGCTSYYCEIPLLSAAQISPTDEKDIYNDVIAKEITKIYKLIYDSCKNRKPKDYYDGNRALHFAAIMGNEQLILHIVKIEGENVDVTNDYGETPLLLVLKSEEPLQNVIEVVKTLIKLGADTSKKDSEGHNALYYIKKSNNDKLISVVTPA